ncbi:hypothetical protein AB1Y20_012070 [Prymnesium parvum]
MSDKQRNVHTKRPIIAAGLGHSAAVLETNELITWGMARQFQLGLDFIRDKDRRNGKTEADLEPPVDRHSPEVVPALKARGDKVVTVACGSSHTLVVSDTGHVFSWGSGAFGKLGHGNDADVRIPTQVEFKRKRIARVSCGPDHSAAVSEAGEVLCWGSGSYGNLGHGDNNDCAAPKLVEALLGKPCISVACGAKHTMALSQAGGVYSWGYGGSGRLGCGDTRGLFRPRLVEKLRDTHVMQIAAGESHSLALIVDRGQLYTWGVGDYGKLGHGDTTPQLLPRHVEYFRLMKLTYASGGTFCSAVCTDGGQIYTWGGGTYGKLGYEEPANALTPRLVNMGSTGAYFVQVACGTFHTIALTKLGDIYSFGFNGNGRLGLAEPLLTDTKPRNKPCLLRSFATQAKQDHEDSSLPADDAQAATTALVRALRPRRVKKLCLGAFHSAALSDQGDVYTWGDGRSGATGIDLSRQEDKLVLRPTRVLGLGGAQNTVTVLASGVRHLLAVTSDGKIYSWGDGSHGRLGHGDQTSVHLPRQISTLKSKRVKTAAAGEEHSVIATVEGDVFSWGSGSFGKLGHGEPSDEGTPRQVHAFAGRAVETVACGYAHTVVICDNHEVLAWGSGWKGKLGLGDDQNRLTPTPIPSLKRKHITQLACGSFHTIVLTEQGDVFTWGIGERGQLGHGDLENRKTPTPLLGLQGTPIGSIAAGEAHTIACALDGSATWSWGAGHYGQLGVGGLDPRLSPSKIDDLDKMRVVSVACGANHSGAVCDDGKVYMWGNAANSRLGIDSSEEVETPQVVPSLSESALTQAVKSDQEPSKLLTPKMMEELQGTNVDAATAQRILDDPAALAERAAQADAEAERRGKDLAKGASNLEELLSLENESSTISTVMAVAMSGRAIKPSLDVLQQVVKAQRENVAEMIENEQRTIDGIKETLDAQVKMNHALEVELIDMEAKVKLVLANHKLVHESLAKSCGYERLKLANPGVGTNFKKELYERMLSVLYEDPQSLSAILKMAEPAEVDALVQVVVERIYANHYKARDEYYMLSLLVHAIGEDVSSVTEASTMLGEVNYVTKLLSAYTRRGPNKEALKAALTKPMSLVLARKTLELEIDPARVYISVLEELRFKTGDADMPAAVTAQEAWRLQEVRTAIKPRIRILLDFVELFLTRIIAARNMLPYGLRVLARKVYDAAKDRFPRASASQQMAGVSNFIFVSYICPAIIQPEAFDLCSASSRPSGAMKRNLLRIASTLKRIGSLSPYDAAEPWYADISALVNSSSEMMKQFYSNLTDVPLLEDQRRVTMYLESTEPLVPTLSLELNSIYLVHSILYRCYADVFSSSDHPLHSILLDLGGLPANVTHEQNRHVLLRLRLSRDMHITQGNRGAGGGQPVDLQSELRHMLLDCLRSAPAVNMRQGDGLKESMDELLHECTQQHKYDAAGKVQKVIELLDASGISASSAGEMFLQTTADEISKRARKRVQLVKERQDLQKIVEFVTAHHETLLHRVASHKEYLEAVREWNISAKSVHTSESLQRSRTSSRKSGGAVGKDADSEKEKVQYVMDSFPSFQKLVNEDLHLAKYIESHPGLTKQQFRDLLDRRPEFMAAFDKHPEELIRIGRAPSLRLMLDSHKDLKAALDKRPEVRLILESKPDLDRTQLSELVSSNAQLKDLYDSRPELKGILEMRARLFEADSKQLEEQRPEAFVAGPSVKVPCKNLVKSGVIVSIALPAKMVAKLTLVFSTVRPGGTNVLALYNNQAVFSFDLQLEELLDMQYNKMMIKEVGKVKLDVGKTLVFLNERMRT